MNSLENLNNWANDSIAYGGDGTYSITFDPTSPTNQSTSVVEDNAFVSPNGTNITAMESTPSDIEYIIDLSGVALPAFIDWGTLPYYISAQTAGTNIFKAVGPIDNLAWDIIKNPQILIPDQATNFSYTASISYPDPSDINTTLTKSWTVSVTVTATADLSTPTDYGYTKNSTGTIAGTPQILNTASGTYTIVITPSVTSYVYTLASFGSGGTSTFDPVLKTLTIVGTKAQVDSHLNGVVLGVTSSTSQTFTLRYNLTNPSGSQTSVNQTLYSIDSYVISTATYSEDTPFSLGYSILDTSSTATSFTVTVAQTTPLPTVSPGYFTFNGSNVGNTWTTSNTKANINAANVIFTPPVDYSGTITLTVSQSKVDNGNTVVQVTDEPNNIVNSGTNNEIVNMINRSYKSNQVNTLFPTQVPYITDGPDIGQTYTIQLSSPVGKIGNSIANALASSSYSFTGNKTACNAEFANIKLLPTYGVSSNDVFHYTQTRGSTVQVDEDLVLTGSIGNITPATYTFSGNTTFSPTWEQSYYGKMDVLSVAGGGGGGATTSGSTGTFSGASGGGGGGVLSATVYPSDANALSSTTTYTVTIGAGGIGYTAPSDPAGGPGGNTQLTTGATTLFQSVGGNGGRWGPSTGGSSGYPSFVSPTTRITGGPGGTGSGGGISGNVGVGGGGGGAGGYGGGGYVYVYNSGTTHQRRTYGGNGGGGQVSTITGSTQYYGGGGGGYGSSFEGSEGGTGGGGGNSGSRYPGQTRNGANGRGGGGAGGGDISTGGGAGGGSGILIIKFS